MTGRGRRGERETQTDLRRYQEKNKCCEFIKNGMA